MAQDTRRTHPSLDQRRLPMSDLNHVTYEHTLRWHRRPSEGPQVPTGGASLHTFGRNRVEMGRFGAGNRVEIATVVQLNG